MPSMYPCSGPQRSCPDARGHAQILWELGSHICTLLESIEAGPGSSTVGSLFVEAGLRSLETKPKTSLPLPGSMEAGLEISVLMPGSLAAMLGYTAFALKSLA